MILRDRVGGGGRAKAFLMDEDEACAGGCACAWACICVWTCAWACRAEDRRRDLTVSAAWTGYAVLDEGDEEDGRLELVEAVGSLVLGSMGGESMLTSTFMAVAVVGVVAVWLPLPPSEPEVPTRAGGGSSKAICRVASCLEPSWPWMSVEEAGVGGNVARGMVEYVGEDDRLR